MNPLVPRTPGFPDPAPAAPAGPASAPAGPSFGDVLSRAAGPPRVAAAGPVGPVAGLPAGLPPFAPGERDGQAYVLVRRHGQELHVYGTGKERQVFEVRRP